MDPEHQLVAQAEKFVTDYKLLSNSITDKQQFANDNYEKIATSARGVKEVADIVLKTITSERDNAFPDIPQIAPDQPQRTASKRKTRAPARLGAQMESSNTSRKVQRTPTVGSRAHKTASAIPSGAQLVSRLDGMRLPKMPDFMDQRFIVDEMRGKYQGLRSNVLGQLKGFPEPWRVGVEHNILRFVHELGSPPAISQLKGACYASRNPASAQPSDVADVQGAEKLASRLDSITQHTGRWGYLKALYQFRIHKTFSQLNRHGHAQAQRRLGGQAYPSTKIMMQEAYPSIAEDSDQWKVGSRRLQDYSRYGAKMARLVDHYESEGVILLLGGTRWSYSQFRAIELDLLFRTIDEGRDKASVRALCEKAKQCVSLLETPELITHRFAFEDLEECDVLALKLDSTELLHVLDEI